MSSTEKTTQRRRRWRGPGPCPESGSHVPANSAEDTVSSGSACQPRPEASCTPTRGGRGVDSGLCAVTSTARPQRRQCGRSPTWTSHPGCQAQDTGHARSADHGHPRDGRDRPTRARGEGLAERHLLCPTGRWLRRRTHLSKVTACTLCSADGITCKPNLPQELIYRKTAGLGFRLHVG